MTIWGIFEDGFSDLFVLRMKMPNIKKVGMNYGRISLRRPFISTAISSKFLGDFLGDAIPTSVDDEFCDKLFSEMEVFETFVKQDFAVWIASAKEWEGALWQGRKKYVRVLSGQRYLS